MSKKWEKYNQEAKQAEDYKDYINERGLEIIRNAEGHFKGPEKVNGVTTTYYGITQKGIDGLEKLSRSYDVKLPDWILSAKVDKLTEKEAKEIAGYHAMLNTKLVDDFSDCNNFSDMELDTRSMFLTYLHNISPYAMRKAYKEGEPGSFLSAVRGNNPYLMARALIQKADGTVMEEFDQTTERNGFKRRSLLPAFALGNKELTFNKAEQIELDNRFKQPGFVQECFDRLTSMSIDYDSLKQSESEKSHEYEAEPSKTTPVNTTLQEEKPKLAEQAAISGYSKFATDFTNWLKKYLTGNNKEVNNNAEGNSDINMQ